MKIWQLDPAQITPYYNMAVCEALAAEKCEVRYFTSKYLYGDTFSEFELVKPEPIYFRGLDKKWLLNLPRLRRVLRGLSYPVGHVRFLSEVKSSPPDVVHVQWSRVPVFDKWLLRQLRRRNVPVVHTIHDVGPLFAASAGTRPFVDIYSSVDRLILHTEANKIDFMRAFPEIPPEKMRVVPLIEYTPSAIPASASRESARAALGLSQNAFVVCFFGSIRHYKGLDILLEAIKEAQKNREDLHLLIAGKFDPLEESLIPRKESMLTIPNLHLHEGYIPTEDTWKYFFASDICVLPYRHIYQSAALITAMGFGVPIIA
ncbi:MAG TPA: glycosyltransferase family 4 protein, partial [Gemmatales bacterium]|nr:glycosyltransferase family 4 protein [Gemmatales bacterium]